MIPLIKSAIRSPISGNLFRPGSSLWLGLQAYYRFGQVSWTGAGSLVDSSGKGNHGSLLGGGTLNSGTGKLGQGFLANGVNYFTLSPSLFPQEAGAVFAWLTSNSSISNSLMRVFSTDDTGGTTKEHRTFRDGVSSPMEFSMANEAGVLGTASLPTVFVNGEWALIGWAWEYDGVNTTITGYLNAVAGTPVVLAGRVQVPDTSFNIGEWSAVILPSPAGVDEVLMYNRVPTLSEIVALYNFGTGRVL